MMLIKFILRTCGGMMLVTTLAALLSGACNAGLIALVNTALTKSRSTSQALLAIPQVSVNIAILLGGAAYLGWLSWRILLAVLGLILFGAIGYRLIVASAFHFLNLAREEEDKLFRSFRALTEGIKELKLHRSRRGAFFAQSIQATTEIFQRHNVAAEVRFVTAQSWSHLLYFAL